MTLVKSSDSKHNYDNYDNYDNYNNYNNYDNYNNYNSVKNNINNNINKITTKKQKEILLSNDIILMITMETGNEYCKLGMMK